MSIKITKKPDDYLVVEDERINVLRASIGGHTRVGYYCVYRGRIQQVADMLEEVVKELHNHIRQGTEPRVDES